MIILQVLKQLTVDGNWRRSRRRGDWVEDHPADAIDADGRHPRLHHWVHRVGGARDRQPVGGAVRLDDAAHGRGAAAGQTERHGGHDCGCWHLNLVLSANVHFGIRNILWVYFNLLAKQQ